MNDSYEDLTTEETAPLKRERNPRVQPPQRPQWMYSWKLDAFLILTFTVSTLIVLAESERPFVKVLAVISLILMIVSRLLARVGHTQRSPSS